MGWRGRFFFFFVLSAWLLQYHTAVVAVPALLFITFLSFAVASVSLYGEYIDSAGQVNTFRRLHSCAYGSVLDPGVVTFGC